MSITSYPTLSQRMNALHSRMVAVAEAFHEQGDVSAATAVKAQAKQLKQELNWFNSDLGAALTGIGVEPKTAKETDLFAGHREATTVAEAEAYRKWYFELLEEIDGERPEGENEKPDPRIIVRELKARCQLLDWIRINVDKIDFNIMVPPSTFTSNPWIAYGHNFESAIKKARDALNKAMS